MRAVATLALAVPPKMPRPTPAHYAAKGRLYRAIVSLPEDLCGTARSFNERWIFFDCSNDRPSVYLEGLISIVWRIDSSGWAEAGQIYNVVEATELIAQNDGEDDTALFECAWGDDGTRYVSASDVDFFVRPRVRALLEAALGRVFCTKGWKGGVA